jgi:hypothetical protein
MELETLYNISEIDITNIDNHFRIFFCNEFKINGKTFITGPKDKDYGFAYSNNISTVEEYFAFKKNWPKYKAAVSQVANYIKQNLIDCESYNFFRAHESSYKEDAKRNYDEDSEGCNSFKEYWEEHSEDYFRISDEDAGLKLDDLIKEFENVCGEDTWRELESEFPYRDMFWDNGQRFCDDRFDEALNETIKQIEEVLNSVEKLTPKECAEEFWGRGIIKYPKCWKYYDQQDFREIIKFAFND